MYRPLPKNVTIRNSEIDGLGLFATEKILKFHVLGITHVQDGEFENGYSRTPLGGFFNHSETPNCEVYEDGRFIMIRAIKDIAPDEELTAFYTLYIPKKD
jgi:SET domain-containing protein